MASLVKAVDRASGYVFQGARGVDDQGRTIEDGASVWAQAMSGEWMGKMEVRDVQERWLERKEEFDEAERQGWREEAVKAGALEQKEEGGGGSEIEKKDEDENEDEMLAEQREWEAQKAKGGGGTRVVRKS